MNLPMNVRWLLVLLPLWCVGLFLRGYWTPDEPREADIIWRMTQQPDLSVPQLATQRFMEKPPLTYWLGAASQHLFGSSPAATRLPNLLYALIACVAVGLLGASMAGARVGLWSALIFGSMFEVVRVQIWLAPDALLLAGCAVSLLGVYRGFVAQSSREKLYWYTLMHAGALLGFMAKSAPGWMVPGLALLTMIVIERRWRELWQWTLWAGLLLQITVIGAWLWRVWLRPDGMEVIKVMFWNNLAGRFTDVHATGALDYASGHKNWPGKYLKESLYYLFPWGPCVVSALLVAIKQVRGDTGRAWRFALAASLPFLVLLMLATTARDVYFVPVCVGLAVLVALWCERHMEDRSTSIVLAFTYGITLLLTLGVVVVLLVVVASQVPDLRRGLTAGAALLLVSAWFMVRWWRAARWHPVWHNSVLFVVTLVVGGGCLSPVVNRMQDLQALATQIHHSTAHDQLAILNPDETTIAMMDYGRGRPITLLDADEQHLAKTVQVWLAGDPRRRVLVLLPGRARGPLSGWVTPKPEDADDGMAAALQQAGVARIETRHELPHGRRYAVLSAITTLN